jgi:hypothetical protein
MTSKDADRQAAKVLYELEMSITSPRELSDGNHSITATASDSEGYVSPYSSALNMTIVAPVVPSLCTRSPSAMAVKLPRKPPHYYLSKDSSEGFEERPLQTLDKTTVVAELALGLTRSFGCS